MYRQLAILPEVVAIPFATAPTGRWIRSEDTPPEGLRRKSSHSFYPSNLQHSGPWWDFDHALVMHEPICLEAAPRLLQITVRVEDQSRETLGFYYL